MTTKLTTFEEEKMREFREKFAHLTEQSANGFLYFKHTNLKVRDFEQEILSPLKQQREMIRKDYVTWVLAGSYASYARKYKGKTPFQEWRQSAEAKDMDDWT